MTSMASWKVKGVVPDSDDEDSLDSQSTAGDADLQDEVQSNELLHGHKEIPEKDGKELLEDDPFEKTFFDDTTLLEDNRIHQQSPPKLPVNTTVSTKSNTDDLRLPPPSSPASLQVFKAPRVLWDLDHDLTDFEDETAGNPQDLPANPVADEISTSYVRLTSPVSSVLSSLPASQREEMPISLSNVYADASRHDLGVSQHASNIGNSTTENATSPTFQESTTLYKRALRERAPIQLHPYAMEQEKYRQTLKARGMTPMRLGHTQDDDGRKQHIPSSDPVSQDLDSQEIDHETEESQAMEFNWDFEPSPTGHCVEGQVQGIQGSGGSVSNDDDEFPDIDELLRGQQSASRQLEPKHRLKVYSSKVERPQLARIQTQRTDPSNVEQMATDVFDPASPPATSPPFPNTARIVWRTVSRPMSISSKEPTPSWLDQDELNFQTAPDLPTPATSAIKPLSDPIFLESDLEDDPFANELSDSGSSSSAESMQIRRVSKKIRGVLPASHLRLDQQLKKQKPPVWIQRDSLSASPQKSAVRRGVALPRAPGATQTSATLINKGLPLLSESEDEENDQNAMNIDHNDSVELESLFPQNRMGYAEEEDRIDAMLPSLKRQHRFHTKPRKKARVGSSSLPRNGAKTYSHQPRITQHLVKESSSKSKTRRRAKYGNAHRKGASERYSKPTPPRLSILDVTDFVDLTDGIVPRFIKVAARTARSRIGQGRQSPSNKYIRLANREDTLDAQSVLEEWKEGKIKPRILGTPSTSSATTLRPHLGRIADNCQTRLPPPMMKIKPRSYILKSEHGRLDTPRQLVVSRDGQMLMRKFVSTEHSPLVTDPGTKATHQVSQRRQVKPRYGAPQSRPAQLESSEVEPSRKNPIIAFKTTKKALDTLFKMNKEHSAQLQNLQLNRFLADDDIIRPSVETAPLADPDTLDLERLSADPPTTLPKLRKRMPQRIDAGAARYRQPSEPLVLDLISPAEVAEAHCHANKLMGLGKFGTRYPIHFDIFPLQSGIFFHESSFIGSGRLSEAIKVHVAVPSDASRGYISFRLGDKDFRWGRWDEDISSEVGLFFDCLFELLIQCPSRSTSSGSDPADALTFIIDYTQHHVSFISSESQCHFLSRMLEVLQDFSSRAVGSGRQVGENAQQWIDTTSRCTVLVLQLLRISRTVQSEDSFQLEDLLKSVSCLCAKLLVRQGLSKLRKLYDDLQYLSFRERGIRSDQYIAVAWVVILRVLDAARIPRGSFWDVTNLALAESDLNNVDAPIMEQIWYSVFSLLPLCEFDEYGFVVPGHRHRISFDNWSIPQRMLRRVFALYSTNAKQSPGFNDYCRALVSRCHFLMREWGWWKCSGMIGTLFDFFASQKLGHLRNEEVYKSPRFLEELNTDPPLDVEPEDRCFHVFLKIVSLAIKHLRQARDEKSIRNLVARLLPNHDRQYPKEETIYQRDLAALRNHHDLLCTLYWAAPQDCRPSLNLIQELVIADRSHKEACLINLRALDNLARYVFTSDENVFNSCDGNAVYQQFTRWQELFFDKLLYQYLDADSEVRREAELLSVSNELSLTESQLKKTIVSNRRSTMEAIKTLLYGLRHNINNAKDANAALSAVNASILSKILNTGIFGVYRDINEDLVGSDITALHDYMDRLDKLQPLGAPQFTSCQDEYDSQGSLDLANVNIERQMMIHPLHETILHNFTAITRDILECRLYQPEEPSFMEDLVLCWARLVSLITEQKYEIRGFLVSGANAIFENRRRHVRANNYWPLFLSQLVKEKGIDGLKVVGFDLGLEWMQVITSNPKSLVYEPTFSLRLYENGHYLLNSDKDAIGFDWLATEWPKRHLYLIQVAVNSIRMIKNDPNYGGFAATNRLSEKERSSLLSTILKSTMDSMQQQLESMMPPTFEHSKYVTFCQDVTSYLRAYTNNIRAVTGFFIHHSMHYWPKGDDPHLYAAGIVSYSLRLHDQRSKTSFELFHYLYNGWKNDQLHSRINNHITCVQKGLRDWSFTEFMLSNFVPATITVGFSTNEGFVLPKIYLLALAKRMPHFLQRNGPEGASTFTHLINILKIIWNGIRIRAINAFVPVRIMSAGQLYIDREDGVYGEHRGIISIVCQFWISIQPALQEYVGVHTADMPTLDEVAAPLNDFILKAAHYVGQEKRDGWDNWNGNRLDVPAGEFVERFVAALGDDIEKNWWVERSHHSVKVKVGGGSTMVSMVEGVPRLDEVLKLGVSYLGGISQGLSSGLIQDADETNEKYKEKPRYPGRFPKWMMTSPVEKFPGVFRGFF